MLLGTVLWSPASPTPPLLPCATDYLQPCGPPAGVPAGVPAGKVGGAAVAGSAPAWVRRARHCAVDATPALLAAAADCPPLELEGQGQHPKAGLASATQGWLAFRLAARLPEAAACCNAEEVLELGAAMAAAAGPPPPLGAALEPRRQLGQGSAAGVGMCHVASRLLAAASRYQAHPMKLEERTNRWFHTRTPTFRKTLHKRLGDAFASTGGAGSAGGRHGGRRVGGGAAHGPSRLGKGAGAAAGQARGSIQRYPPAGRSAMTGVKNSGYGSFWATSTIRGKQIWLGTYRTQAAVSQPALRAPLPAVAADCACLQGKGRLPFLVPASACHCDPSEGIASRVTLACRRLAVL